MDNMYLRNLTELFFKENEKLFVLNKETRKEIGKDKDGNSIYEAICPQHYKCGIGQSLYNFYHTMHKIDKLMDKFKIPFVKSIKPHETFDTPHLEYFINNSEGEICRIFSVVIIDNNFSIRHCVKDLPRYKDNTPIVNEKYLTENQAISLNLAKEYTFVNSIETQVYSDFSRVLDYKASDEYYYFDSDEFEKEYARIWKRMIDKETHKVKKKTLNRIIKTIEP